MVIEYTAEREDVAALYSYARKHSTRVALISYGLPVAFALLFLAEIQLMIHTLSLADWIIALIGGAAFFFLFPVILRLRTKKSKRTLSIDPDKLSTRIGKLRGEVPWVKMDTLHVTNEHVFLIGKNTNGFAIPRRAFLDEAQRNEFIRLCERYMHTAKA